MKTTVALLALLWSVTAWSQDRWDPTAKRAYVERCTLSLKIQGVPVQKGRPFCGCMANGMESEFGRSEYPAMMNAQPNPHGSAVDRRLHGVVRGCAHIMR